MLVLTRKIGEGIVIGDDVRITVLEDREGKIRIGIDAPRDKKIYRQEVYDRICQENKDASQWDLEKIEALQAVLPGRKKDQE